MKNRTFKVFYVIFIFNLIGCKNFIGEWNISELYGQKIEGTSKILYKYDAWGGRDSHIFGFIVLDSTMPFKIDLKSGLAFYNLSDIPSKFNIEGVKFECYNSCGDEYKKSKPIFDVIKTDTFKSNEIKIIERTFQYRGFSEKERGLERFVFEKFEETKDSLIFYNLDDIESMNGIHLDQLKIRKGEVYLKQNEKSELIKLFINEVRLNKKTKAIENFRTLVLTPRNKITNTKFSEIGIFREIKIK